MPTSPAAAYRADVVGRDAAFGVHDGGWIAVATLLEHAPERPAAERSVLLRDAIEFAEQIVGSEQWMRRAAREWQDLERTASEVILLLADDVQSAGALHLAAVLLDALLRADDSLTPVQRGRVMVRRARVAWKMGAVDEATERVRALESLGRRVKSPELKVRAWIAFASLAQMRGNFPEMEAYGRRAVRLATRHGLVKLAREGHLVLMIAAGMGRRVDEALTHGWAVYTASVGDRLEEAETLSNLGQALYDAGHPAEALAAFSAVVSRELPARLMLGALGGLALAAAAAGQAKLVDWAAAEVERVVAAAVPRWSLGLALVECAAALAMIARPDDAERLRVRALHIGQAHRFHEIVHRAEALEVRTPPAANSRQELGKRAASVARQVSWMEPERLPEHVSLTVALA